MEKKREMISDAVRKAIDASGMSRYAICKTLGIDQGGMSRFMHGQGALSQKRIDAIGELLGLRVVCDGVEGPKATKPTRSRTTKGDQ